ncbi:GNAT family N-acetyltransferase [Cyclobacterium jeungdonense]|uniref:GNAT family N-acetyltransferase n=1 Tax=Cyclobacterium jeungdonense TaxID=708087 RepID=A0ABT8C7M4_9BACT|nr:GNAT family N-acetyltransferase [Cyclobacterium jeungdonense]MDN3687813.1 GNAT family N-acetyltransferase [Cyclobacterium jeungdonense]
MEKIKYQEENHLSVYEFKELLIASTLGERRPVTDINRLETMLQHANLILTARKHGRLVGVARSITDQAFCTYLSDLAVHQDYQKQGIGKTLILKTKAAYPLAKLILLSAPKAVGFYPKIGMSKHPHCYFLDDPTRIT